MNAKTERFELRLDRETLDQIDNWRASRPVPLPRAEAVRQLASIGLALSGEKEVKLSSGEKIILMMFRDLYKHLEMNNTDIDPEFVAETIWGGHYWGLGERLPGLLHGYVDNPHSVSEVIEVLTMWYFIESGYESFGESDKQQVELECGGYAVFPGFDGNSENEHLDIANYLIKNLERFTNFLGRDLNSHMPRVDVYRRMLNIFRPMYPLPAGAELSASQIVDLLKVHHSG